MRRVWLALAGLALLVSLLLSVLRELVVSDRVLAIASSFASYAVLGFAFALVVLLLQLRRAHHRSALLAGAALCAAGLVLHAVWLAPLFVGDGAVTGAGGDRVVVLNANLEFGEGEAASVVGAVRSRSVDVLVLEEATPDAVRRLRADGLARLLPHVAGRSDVDSAGTMVWSRFALTDPQRVDVSNGAVAVTVAAPTAFRLVAAHPSQPLIAPGAWVADLREVRRVAAGAVRRGPVAVVGDLNSSWDNKAFRDLTSVGRHGPGLRDAAEAAGSGWQPTWPSMRVVPLPRLLTLDHVLTSRALVATSTATVEVPDSDHRALLAVLRVR